MSMSAEKGVPTPVTEYKHVSILEMIGMEEEEILAVEEEIQRKENLKKVSEEKIPRKENLADEMPFQYKPLKTDLQQKFLNDILRAEQDLLHAHRLSAAPDARILVTCRSIHQAHKTCPFCG